MTVSFEKTVYFSYRTLLRIGKRCSSFGSFSFKQVLLFHQLRSVSRMSRFLIPHWIVKDQSETEKIWKLKLSCSFFNISSGCILLITVASRWRQGKTSPTNCFTKLGKSWWCSHLFCLTRKDFPTFLSIKFSVQVQSGRSWIKVDGHGSKWTAHFYTSMFFDHLLSHFWTVHIYNFEPSTF